MKENLSTKITHFCDNYESPTLEPLVFGNILYYLCRDYDIMEADEESCCRALDDLIEDWIEKEYIAKVISIQNLNYKLIFEHKLKSIEDIEKVISENFKIFETKITKSDEFKNRRYLRYYRNPDYSENRRYINIICDIESDGITIINIQKGKE